MKNIKFENNEEEAEWHPVIVDGKMRCSCGRELVKVDDNTYKCSYGYPLYRMDMGDIIKDKFGNLLFRGKSH